jgi:anti-anti-sigma factor
MRPTEERPAIELELLEPTATVVHVRGELDMGTAHQFRAVLRQAVSGNRPVIVDLLECPFIDSLSIGMLITTQRALAEKHEQSTPLAIVATGFVVQALDMLGKDFAPPVYSTVGDALGAVADGDGRPSD